MRTKTIATVYAILAAALYAINIPISKLLLSHAGATMMAAFLYLGAGIGLLIYGSIEKIIKPEKKQERLTRKELPYTVAMIVLDIIAPILLMFGIARTNSANVSLLNNFEIVATSIIALVIFKEVISHKLWLAIFMVTIASVILSFEGMGAFTLNEGSLLVLGACICWGFENNCTKMISNKSSTEIVVIKGCFSGMGSLIIALLLGESVPEIKWIFAILFLGFVAYGLSIKLYIMAQQHLGAAKTSVYYSIAPFLGVAFSMALLGERPAMQFYIAMIIMIASTAVMVNDTISPQHTHERATDCKRRCSALELKKVMIVIVSFFVVSFISLFIISGFSFREKREWIMEQLGAALSNKDIELLDELIASNCEMNTEDGKLRLYSYQRGVIAGIWSEKTYTVSSYQYFLTDSEICFWTKDHILNTFRMTIIDEDGREYELSVILGIKKVGLFDAKIVKMSALLLEK